MPLALSDPVQETIRVNLNSALDQTETTFREIIGGMTASSNNRFWRRLQTTGVHGTFKDVLDPAQKLLDEVNAAGNTVVLITHEAEVAARTGRIIHVLDGNVLDGNDPQSSDLVTNASIKFGKSAWGESK